MPYEDEEYPGQPLWQSVLLFCCKGMIEGIMVILFFWLLVQVLFTKQLEVHLQVLLLVGLIVFCLCLFLGCILCCWKTRLFSPNDKDSAAAAPAPAPADVASFAQSSTASDSTVSSSGQRYEELDGDMQLEYPPTFTQHSQESTVVPGSFSHRTPTAPERKEQPKAHFSLRRLSTPQLTSPLYKPMDQSHFSLPSFPKLGLLSRTCRALQRRCTITGDSLSYNEHSRLTSPGAVSPSMPDEPIPLTPLSYGSGASSEQPLSPKPCLHFTMTFSAEQQTLAVTVLGLSGTLHRLEDVSVLGSLPPLFPCPRQASRQSGGRPALLLLKVNSGKELQRCSFRAAVYTREPPHGSTALGEVEAQCGGKDWHSERPFHFTEELKPNKWKLKQDTSVHRGLSFLPQIFISLQYQTLQHQIKTSVLRAENLQRLSQTSAADYQVVINLRHGKTVIGSRETERGSRSAWNSSFLFDLPPGEVSQLPLTLEYVVLQNEVQSDAKVLLGRVVIGAEAADGGRAHWRDMCSLHMEQTRWHKVQPEPL